MVIEAAFVILLIEAGDFYISNPTKTTVFHAFSFYRFSEQLLNSPHFLYDESDVLLKTSFVAFTNEKVTNALMSEVQSCSRT